MPRHPILQSAGLFPANTAVRHKGIDSPFEAPFLHGVLDRPRLRRTGSRPLAYGANHLPEQGFADAPRTPTRCSIDQSSLSGALMRPRAFAPCAKKRGIRQTAEDGRHAETTISPAFCWLHAMQETVCVVKARSWIDTRSRIWFSKYGNGLCLTRNGRTAPIRRG